VTLDYRTKKDILIDTGLTYKDTPSINNELSYIHKYSHWHRVEVQR